MMQMDVLFLAGPQTFDYKGVEISVIINALKQCAYGLPYTLLGFPFRDPSKFLSLSTESIIFGTSPFQPLLPPV